MGVYAHSLFKTCLFCAIINVGQVLNVKSSNAWAMTHEVRYIFMYALQCNHKQAQIRVYIILTKQLPCQEVIIGL